MSGTFEKELLVHKRGRLRVLEISSLTIFVACVHYEGPHPTDEQLFVLRNVAVAELGDQRCRATTHFTHELCSGSIHRGDQGAYLDMYGTYYRADLGYVEGKPWFCTFFIPQGSEEWAIDETHCITSVKPLPGNLGYEDEHLVDPAHAVVPAVCRPTPLLV